VLDKLVVAQEDVPVLIAAACREDGPGRMEPFIREFSPIYPRILPIDHRREPCRASGGGRHPDSLP
jgi:hypothetical protein